MIQFKPFKGIRPSKSNASAVTVRSVDFYDTEKVEVEKDNVMSFHNIIAPVLGVNPDLDKTSAEVRRKMENFLEENTLMKDRKSYYIYEQESEGQEKCLGIVGLVSVDDYEKGLIKKHENTIPDLEKVFTQYAHGMQIQADPVLLTYPESQSIELIVSMTTRKTPTLEFVGVDEKKHRLWQVKDRLVMSQLKKAIEKLPSLYIADGHHRLASSLRYAKERREKDEDFWGGEAYNYSMAILVPGNFLQIIDYNRLVTDLNGLSTPEFLEKISRVFSVIEKDEPYYPVGKHHISMYLDGKFYALYVNQEFRGIPKGVGELDIYLWEEHMMKPILGIKDSKEDKRVKFVKGTGDVTGILKIKEKVDSGEFKVGFGFYPIQVKDFTLVADEGQTMPPKSTYIMPKVLSALTILDLED